MQKLHDTLSDPPPLLLLSSGGWDMGSKKYTLRLKDAFAKMAAVGERHYPNDTNDPMYKYDPPAWGMGSPGYPWGVCGTMEPAQASQYIA